MIWQWQECKTVVKENVVSRIHRIETNVMGLNDGFIILKSSFERPVMRKFSFINIKGRGISLMTQVV